MKEQLKEFILNWIDTNYGQSEKEEPSYNIDLLAEELANNFFVGEGVGFERIRRITGYLVGTVDRFNDGKKAEEHDRVKHSFEGGE